MINLRLSYDGLCQVISGGQTGADLAGLVAAKEAGIKTGGTAPTEFMTSIGRNPGLAEFGLVPRGSLKTRTLENVMNSDATLVLASCLKSPGTAFTINSCLNNKKPYMIIDISVLDNFLSGTAQNPTGFISAQGLKISNWVYQNSIRVLNVAGNRQAPNTYIFEASKSVLECAFYTLDLRGLVVKDSK